MMNQFYFIFSLQLKLNEGHFVVTASTHQPGPSYRFFWGQKSLLSTMHVTYFVIKSLLQYTIAMC